MSYLHRRATKHFFFVFFSLFLILSNAPPCLSQEKSFAARDQTPVHKADHEISPDLLIGERLFYGLAPFEAGKFNCEACHSAVSSDTLNWNPSAYDLSVWLKGKKDSDVKKAFDMPSSGKMEGSHKGMQLTDAEVARVRVYLEYIHKVGLAPHKPFPIRLIIFFFAGLLMALALVDMVFTRYIKYRAIHWVVLAGGLLLHVQMAITEGEELGRTKDYAPDQPIKFSHKVHAGDNKIDCQYCHTGVETGKSAGLPSVALCMNCHGVVRTGRHSGKFEINKVAAAFAQGKPIAWVRIHNLPDHAYFNHSQHVNAGGVECQTCHGPAESMDLMRQYSDLSMGWCVNCHRDTRVQFEQNAYYHQNKKLLEMVRSGKIKEVNAESTGGLDCMRCHY